MDRFFLSPERLGLRRLALKGEEGHHAVRVMRKKVGDRIEVFDGEGKWARGEVREVQRAGLTLQVDEEGESERVLPQIELAVAIPKGKTMDLIVQKAVELGVNRIQPLTTTNTVVKVAADEAVEKSTQVATGGFGGLQAMWTEFFAGGGSGFGDESLSANCPREGRG